MYTFREVGKGFINCFSFSTEFSLLKDNHSTSQTLKDIRAIPGSFFCSHFLTHRSASCCRFVSSGGVFASVERVPGKNLVTGTAVCVCDLPARQWSTPDARAGRECMGKGTELC